jgi:methylphosphotriester-DNA--protein-cysteine methyltransferase
MTRVVLSSASELEDERWRAVEERSQRDDGRFIFAVRTTGI